MTKVIKKHQCEENLVEPTVYINTVYFTCYTNDAIIVKCIYCLFILFMSYNNQ